MQGTEVGTFEETYVVTRTRKVRVYDEEAASVTAWHGGRLLAELGGGGSVPAALREAAAEARRYGVGPGSTLSLRVSRTLTRRRELVEEDRREARSQRMVVYRRHVHDVVAGDLPVSEATLSFRLGGWVAVPHGDDPARYAPFYAAPEADEPTPAALFAGYGHGAPAWDAARIVEPETSPPPDRKPGKAWHRVAMEGTLPVLVPPGGSVDELLGMGFSMGIDTDFSMIPDDVRSAGVFQCCHNPEDRILRPLP
jgi:hypothetical protein